MPAATPTLPATLRELAKALDDAPRESNGPQGIGDDPEGSSWIKISDTLARQFSQTFKSTATRVEHLEDLAEILDPGEQPSRAPGDRDLVAAIVRIWKGLTPEERLAVVVATEAFDGMARERVEATVGPLAPERVAVEVTLKTSEDLGLFLRAIGLERMPHLPVGAPSSPRVRGEQHLSHRDALALARAEFDDARHAGEVLHDRELELARAEEAVEDALARPASELVPRELARATVEQVVVVFDGLTAVDPEERDETLEPFRMAWNELGDVAREKLVEQLIQRGARGVAVLLRGTKK